MIRTAGLTKVYSGHTALHEVDLDVPTGSVYGLVGPNGSGKTTMLGLIVGLRQPTSGELHVDAPTGQIAVLPDTPRFDEWLTGREVVALALRLVRGAVNEDRVTEILQRTGIADAARRQVGGYSRGMLQRLGVAAALVTDPRLVLLDEPASALDPQGRRELLDLIGRLRGDATVLFSSHILSDVQEVCDSVGVLHHGRLLFQGPLDEMLVGAAVPGLRIRTRQGAAAAAAALAQTAWVTSVEELDDDQLTVEVTSVEDAERGIAAVLATSGVRVVAVQPQEVSLEQAFLELVGDQHTPDTDARP